MGIAKSGILGPFSKKVGPAIGRIRGNQNVITALYQTRSSTATAQQTVLQKKFGLLNSFLGYIDELVNIGFGQFAKRKSPVNAAYVFNWKHAFVNEGDSLQINYPKIVYSRGHVVTPESVQAANDSEGIAFRWLPQPQSAYCQFSDLASFLVYNHSKQHRILLINKVNRYALEFTVEIPSAYAGDTVHCYMNFTSANGRHTGDSIYVGQVEVT